MLGKFRKKNGGTSNFKWYNWLIDLVIVFVGVYLAFLFTGYSENEKNAKQRDKVLKSLKLELESLRFTLPQIAGFQQRKAKEWRQALSEKQIVEFYDYVFIQPQYDYMALEYAIGINETDVVDYELFTSLRELYNELKKLEHAENMMTNTAQLFRNMPSTLSKKSTAYQERYADNIFYFLRFINFADNRAEILERAGQKATEALVLINKSIPKDVRLIIEKQLIANYLKESEELPPKEQMIAAIKQFFPHLKDQDFIGIIEKHYAQ